MMTVEERERRAYIEGDTTLAAVLGELLDAQGEIVDLEYQIENPGENPND